MLAVLLCNSLRRFENEYVKMGRHKGANARTREDYEDTKIVASSPRRLFASEPMMYP
jgi:hypothetical protein